MRIRAPGVVLFVLASLVAVWLLSRWAGGPVLTGDSASAGAFSVERARSHLEVLTRAPRPVGSAGHAQARDYLLETLASFGFSVEVQRVPSVALTARGTVVGAAVEN